MVGRVLLVGRRRARSEMEWWRCFCRSRAVELPAEPRPFSLPKPLPQWPPGKGFAKGRICIGELEVAVATEFRKVWGCHLLSQNNKGATFYRPIGIPYGFYVLGHYAQPNNQPLHGFVLVARELDQENSDLPALQRPLDYKLVWGSHDLREFNRDGHGYIWFPCPPIGYKAMGYVVTNSPDKPSLQEVQCVRSDLTDTCEARGLIFTTESISSSFPFRVQKTIPTHRGMWGKGVSAGTFCCSSSWLAEEEPAVSCLRNVNSELDSMPNLDQIHAIIKNYGPTIFFHPKETYLPSSVLWFFKNGAMLYRRGVTPGDPIDIDGSNLPSGGANDGEYWIGLPEDDTNGFVILGNLDSAELYVHVKPALGGTFTDIVMWVFCPFNGPGTLKLGVLNYSMSKVGQHVGDWEHFTLRVSNFTGELWGIYFSQHSGGEWVDASGLEFIKCNRGIVYSSKSGHASFPHPGNYLQGSGKLGIGIRNDAARSDLYIDSSIRYNIVAAEYLGGVVSEPPWLQYMREWGPTIVYDSKSELDRIISHFPMKLRFLVENMLCKLPLELYGEEGPTGPKEKNNWAGDERF